MALEVFCRNYHFNSFSQWLWFFVVVYFFNSLVGTLVKYRVKTESFFGDNGESGPLSSFKVL